MAPKAPQGARHFPRLKPGVPCQTLSSTLSRTSWVPSYHLRLSSEFQSSRAPESHLYYKKKEHEKWRRPCKDHLSGNRPKKEKVGDANSQPNPKPNRMIQSIYTLIELSKKASQNICSSSSKVEDKSAKGARQGWCEVGPTAREHPWIVRACVPCNVTKIRWQKPKRGPRPCLNIPRSLSKETIKLRVKTTKNLLLPTEQKGQMVTALHTSPTRP